MIDLAAQAADIVAANHRVDDPDGLLFLGARSGHPINIRGPWKRCLAAAGVRRDFVPHQLRHTLGTLLAEQGLNEFQIAAALGHSRPNAVTARYVQIRRDNLRAVMQGAADALLPRAKPAA